MPNLSITLPHQFDRAEAKKKAQDAIAQLRQQYGGTLGHLEERWEGDMLAFTFVAMGMPVNGQAHIEDKAVRLEIDLPWLLTAISGKVKQVIEQHGQKLLGSR